MINDLSKNTCSHSSWLLIHKLEFVDVETAIKIENGE